jgi:hypothetical protein
MNLNEVRYENYVKKLQEDIYRISGAIKSEKIYEKKIILLMELFLETEQLGKYRYIDNLKLSRALIEFQNDFDNCDPRSFDYLIDRLSKGSYKV